MKTLQQAMGRRGGALPIAWMFAALALAWVAAPTDAAAQLGAGCTGRARERVEQYLDETGRVLAEARTVVEQSDSERARRLLVTAVQSQEDARQALGRGECAMAGRRSESARDQARLAVRTAREDQVGARRSAEAIERARRLYERASGAVGECDSDPAETLLGRAREQLEQAESAQAEGHYETALRLAQSSERLMLEAVRQCDRGGAANGGRVERELERTDAFLARAEPIVAECGRQPAKEQYDHAVDAQARAREFWSQGRGEPALRMTRQAQKFLRRAVELCGGGHASDEVAQRAIEATQALYDRVEPRVKESGNAAAVQTLSLAADHLASARKYLSDGEAERSLAEAKVARNLILRAAQLAGLPGDDLD